MKRLVALLLSLLLFVSLMGTTAFAEDPVTLNFWGWGFEWEGYTDNFKANYPEEAIDFNHVTHNADEIQVPLDLALADPDSDEYPDLFCAEAGFVRKYIESDKTMDLGELFGGKDALMAALEESGVDQYLVGIGTDAEGRIKGLCFQNVANTLFYRRSAVLEYLGTDDPDEIYEKYCKDPDTFINTCIAITEKSGGKVAGISSYEDISHGYRMFMDSYAIVDGKFVLQDAYLRCLTDLQTLEDAKAVNGTGLFGESWYQDVQNVSEKPAVFYPGSPWKMGVLMSANIGETSGDWAATVSPYQNTQGGTWLCIGKDTKYPEAAKRFMEYWALDTSEKGQYQLVANNGDCPASAAVIKRISESGFAYDICGGQNTLAVYSKCAAAIGADSPAIKYYDTVSNSIFGTLAGVAKSMTQGKVDGLEGALAQLCSIMQESYNCDIPDANEIHAYVEAYLAK